MRKITIDAYNAFTNNTRFKKDNTEVIINDNCTVMKLHGNEIVKKIDDEIFISTAGWPTNTTRERLYPFVRRIRKHRDSLIINEKVKIDSEWYNLNELK